MAMAENNSIQGNVTGKIKFNIDKKSWDNLETFQKKLKSVKAQMAGLGSTTLVNSVTKAQNTISKNKVANVQKETKAEKEQAQVVVASEKEKAKAEKARAREAAKAEKEQMRLEKQRHNEQVKAVKEKERLAKKLASQRAKEESLAESIMAGINKQNAKAIAESKARQAVKDSFIPAAPKPALGTDRSYAIWWQEALREKDQQARQQQQEQRRLAKEANKTPKQPKTSDGKWLSDEKYERKTLNFIKGQQMLEERRLRMRGASEQMIEETRDKIGKYGQDLKKTWSDKNDIESFRRNLSIFRDGLATNDRVAHKSRITLQSLRGELVQLTAAYGAFAIAVNVAQEGMKFESLRATALAFTGSEQGTKEHLQWVADMTERIGLNFMTAAKEFNTFSMAVGDKANTGTKRRIFESVSEYATVLQVDKMQYERALRSINQMYSKGQLYAEELDI